MDPSSILPSAEAHRRDRLCYSRPGLGPVGRAVGALTKPAEGSFAALRMTRLVRLAARKAHRRERLCYFATACAAGRLSVLGRCAHVECGSGATALRACTPRPPYDSLNSRTLTV